MQWIQKRTGAEAPYCTWLQLGSCFLYGGLLKLVTNPGHFSSQVPERREDECEGDKGNKSHDEQFLNTRHTSGILPKALYVFARLTLRTSL